MAACLGIAVDIIEPAGFDLSDRTSGAPAWTISKWRRSPGMSTSTRFEDWRRGEGRRLVLFSTKAATPYTDFAFADGDILLFGRESAGVPDHVHDSADARLLIPMKGGGRSLNVALAAAMAAGEAMRQLG